VSAHGPQGLVSLQKYWLKEGIGLEQLCPQEPLTLQACKDCVAPDMTRQADTYFNGRFYLGLRAQAGTQGSVWTGVTVHGQWRLFDRNAVGVFGGIGPEGALAGIRGGQIFSGFFGTASLRGMKLAPWGKPDALSFGVGYDFRPVGTFPFKVGTLGLEPTLNFLINYRPGENTCGFHLMTLAKGRRELCLRPELGLAFEI
jgi:hypothetical protein